MSSPFSKWQASKHHIKLSYHFNLHFSKVSVLSSKNSSQDLLEPWQSCRMEMVETRICEHWWFCNDPREQSHGTEGPRRRGFRALTWCPCTWSVHKMPILPPWILTIMLGAGTYFQLPPPALPCRPPWLPLPRINILLSVSISWNTWPAKMMTKGIRICFWRLCRLCRATVMNYHKLSSLNNQKVLCQFEARSPHPRCQQSHALQVLVVVVVVVVQSLSHVRLFATPRTAACQASLSITNSRSLLKLMSIESVMPSNHLILWHPPLLLSSIFSSIRVFSKESVLHIRWPKY